MFDNMRDKSDSNATSDLLWDHFFKDRKPKKTGVTRCPLVGLGYRFVSIYETDDRSTHFLHVERMGVHTPASLLSQAVQMNVLASKFGIDSHDGMDVGPVLGWT